MLPLAWDYCYLAVNYFPISTIGFACWGVVNIGSRRHLRLGEGHATASRGIPPAIYIFWNKTCHYSDESIFAALVHTALDSFGHWLDPGITVVAFKLWIEPDECYAVCFIPMHLTEYCLNLKPKIPTCIEFTSYSQCGVKVADYAMLPLQNRMIEVYEQGSNIQQLQTKDVTQFCA